MFPLLQKTSLWAALSPLGKSMETPKGIFYWSSRAKNEAEIDGTIGVAQDDDGTISHLNVAESWAGEKIMQRVPKGKIFGYTPIPGHELLRKKWLAKMLEQHSSLAPHAILPVVTNGITHSLALASRLLLEAGQTIVTADKSWENYAHIFSDLQGIRVEAFKIFTPEGVFNINGIIEACQNVAKKQKKVVLLLNFPHNQTGFMPTPGESKELGEKLQACCREYPDVPFAILLDDAYEGYVYDEAGQKHSMASELFAKLPNLSLIKLDGISKVMLAYGYRVGFVTCFLNGEMNDGLHAEVASKIGGFIRGEISQVNHHGQALADALMDDWATVTKERAQVIDMLKDRWQTMMAAIASSEKKFGREKLRMDPCNGGFFCYFNVIGRDPKEIADRLLKEKKVGVVPSAQGLRVAFCGVSKQKIPKMVEAIFGVVHAGQE